MMCTLMKVMILLLTMLIFANAQVVIQPKPETLKHGYPLMCKPNNPCACKSILREVVVHIKGEESIVEWVDNDCDEIANKKRTFPPNFHCVQLKAYQEICKDVGGRLLPEPVDVIIKYGCELRHV